MITQEEVLQMLKDKNAYLEGHFRLSSGRHAGKYMQCAKIMQYPEDFGKLCAELASYFKDENITLVAGPAVGAVIFSYEMGRALGVKTIFAEREDGVMTFRRGFEVSPEDRVLVVEDVITTGGSCKEVIKAVQEKGATVVSAASIVDRSAGKVDMGVPFKALLSMEIESFTEDECPLCKQGMPIVKPGSRKFDK